MKLFVTLPSLALKKVRTSEPPPGSDVYGAHMIFYSYTFVVKTVRLICTIFETSRVI